MGMRALEARFMLRIDVPFVVESRPNHAERGQEYTGVILDLHLHLNINVQYLSSTPYNNP